MGASAYNKYMTTQNIILIVLAVIISQTVCNVYIPESYRCARYFGIFVLLMLFYIIKK
jgi:hypothetical protein